MRITFFIPTIIFNYIVIFKTFQPSLGFLRVFQVEIGSQQLTEPFYLIHEGRGLGKRVTI